MKKLEKIILSCLADLVQSNELKSLESDNPAAKKICKTIRKVVKVASDEGIIDLNTSGEKS
jgi:hypothetical protein